MLYRVVNPLGLMAPPSSCTDFDTKGDMWLSNYGNDTKGFVRDLERVYQQIEPLYRQLHAYVRRKLREVSSVVGWGQGL